MLMIYKRMVGPMSRGMFMGSTVGVMMAASAAMMMTANRHWSFRNLGFTTWINVNATMMIGNSKAIPSQNMIPVAKEK